MVMKHPPLMQQLPMQPHQSRGVHAQRLSSLQQPSMQKRLMHHSQRMTQLQQYVLCVRGAPHPATVGVKLIAPELFDQEPVHELDGLSLDRLDVECTRYQPAPELLTAEFNAGPVTETLTSNLLKSNCLVTGQPDWGSVQISYSGPQIDQAGLLQYIVSFRNHNEFHEQCVERIYMDIMARCKPTKLMVYARYTRRGGLDINPWRSSHPQLPPANVRTARQ